MLSFEKIKQIHSPEFHKKRPVSYAIWEKNCQYFEKKRLVSYGSNENYQNLKKRGLSYTGFSNKISENSEKKACQLRD